jgi:hypothetical protein
VGGHSNGGGLRRVDVHLDFCCSLQTDTEKGGGKEKPPMYRRIVGRILGNPPVGTSESVTGK